MKRRPTPYPLIGAVAFGLLAVVGFYFYQLQVAKEAQDQVDRARDQIQAAADHLKYQELLGKVHEIEMKPQDSGPTHEVLYASQDIDAGVPITADMFTATATPDNLVKEAFTADDANMVVKSVSLRSIRKGDPLTEGNVGLEAPHLSGRIPVGMKAMSVNALSGDGNLTGGFLADGDCVDLLLLHPSNPNDPKSGIACDAVIQNLPVVYVPGAGQHSTAMEGINPSIGQGQPTSIMVEVTLQEAQMLSLLQSIPQNRLQMVLRSRIDTTPQRTKTETSEEIQDNPLIIASQVSKSILKAQAIAAQLKATQDKAAVRTLPAPSPTP